MLSCCHPARLTKEVVLFSPVPFHHFFPSHALLILSGANIKHLAALREELTQAQPTNPDSSPLQKGKDESLPLQV